MRISIGTVLSGIAGSFVASDQVSNMVLHSNCRWTRHGAGGLYQSDIVFAEESLLCDILRHTVFLYCGGSGNVLCESTGFTFQVALLNTTQAAIYTLISISVNRVGKQFAPLGPKVILWIFIVSDVLVPFMRSLTQS